jgi:Ala-tRNA(Pro) deacylase
MPIKKLRDFLDKEGVKYVNIGHSPAYTAQEIAASAHVPGKDLAKTVMVKLDGRMAMAILPAAFAVDFDLLARAAGVAKAGLASEEEFRGAFPECELGAMPPFGNLYEMEVYADKRLKEDEHIAFNAGSHMELVKLSYADFERLVKPKTAEFAVRR